MLTVLLALAGGGKDAVIGLWLRPGGSGDAE